MWLTGRDVPLPSHTFMHCHPQELPHISECRVCKLCVPTEGEPEQQQAQAASQTAGASKARPSEGESTSTIAGSEGFRAGREQQQQVRREQQLMRRRRHRLQRLQHAATAAMHLPHPPRHATLSGDARSAHAGAALPGDILPSLAAITGASDAGKPQASAAHSQGAPSTVTGHIMATRLHVDLPGRQHDPQPAAFVTTRRALSAAAAAPPGDQGAAPPIDGVTTHMNWVRLHGAGAGNGSALQAATDGKALGVEVITAYVNTSFEWDGRTYHIAPQNMVHRAGLIRTCRVCRGCKHTLRWMPKGGCRGKGLRPVGRVWARGGVAWRCFAVARCCSAVGCSQGGSEG